MLRIRALFRISIKVVVRRMPPPKSCSQLTCLRSHFAASPGFPHHRWSGRTTAPSGRGALSPLLARRRVWLRLPPLRHQLPSSAAGITCVIHHHCRGPALPLVGLPGQSGAFRGPSRAHMGPRWTPEGPERPQATLRWQGRASVTLVADANEGKRWCSTTTRSSSAGLG